MVTTSRLRAPAALLFVALLAVGLVAVDRSPAGAAVGEPESGLPPGIGIGLLDVPVERSEDPRANQYIIDHVIPGATVQRRIQVSNGTDEPVPIEMVPAAARIEDGWVIEAENPPGSIAEWMTMSPSAFTLAPQSVVEVTATIRVPGGLPPGERYGAFVAQPPAVEVGSVGLISRVGLRVYLSVGGDEPETDFEIDTLTASRTEEGAPSVDVGILNTGGRAIDVSGELLLQDETGTVTAGPFPTALPKTLAPRSRDQVTVPLPESLASGPWDVTATMRSGLVERVAEATIVFPDEPGASSDPAESETIGGTDEDGNDISEEIRNQRRTLLPLAALLILLSLGALWLMLLWRRREADEEDEEAVDRAAAVGDSRPPDAG